MSETRIDNNPFVPSVVEGRVPRAGVSTSLDTNGEGVK